MKNNDIEKIINEVYPGLTHYVRDANINSKLVKKYKEGQILYEKAFVDCTNKIGCLTRDIRYSILSNNAKDLSQYEQGTNWGLHVINRDGCFKVLDVFKYKNKFLITLLHIPMQYDIYFKNLKNNLDKDLIKNIRKSFIESFNQLPIESLDENWYKRLEYPIGIDDSGNFFTK